MLRRNLLFFYIFIIYLFSLLSLYFIEQLNFTEKFTKLKLNLEKKIKKLRQKLSRVSKVAYTYKNKLYINMFS